MAKDMMPGFTLYQPTDLQNALNLITKFGSDGWILAGGYDSLDWFKDRIKRPNAVIEIGDIPELRGVRETPNGIEIGALTTLTEIHQNSLINKKFGLLSEAAGKVASPQIRNHGTIGGNVCQDARCWYYRAGLDCYRAGGNTCYADSPQGMNREHCLFNANRCVAVSPSDTAPALIALEAEMVLVNQTGTQSIPAEDFFIGPGVDITKMTVLKPGDVLTTIRIPNTWAGSEFYFEKVADRNAWDFALVNIAAAIRIKDALISDIRMVCGGVECVPKRLTVVENVVRGNPRDDETAQLAANSASRGATPLNQNHFKIPLMENLVKRALREV